MILNPYLNQLDSLSKTQMINALVAPTLRDYYNWNREDIGSVETIEYSKYKYDFKLLLENKMNCVGVAVLENQDELDPYIEFLDNSKDVPRYFLIIARRITKFYDIFRKRFIEDVDFFSPETLSFLVRSNQDFISTQFDLLTIENVLDKLQEPEFLQEFLNSQRLNFTEESTRSFCDQFIIAAYSKDHPYFNYRFTNIRSINLKNENDTRKLIGSNLLEYSIVHNNRILDSFKNKTNQWSIPFERMLTHLFKWNDIDLSDTHFANHEILTVVKQEKLNEIIFSNNNTRNYGRIKILMKVLDYLEKKRNLRLDIFIIYETEENQNEN